MSQRIDESEQVRTIADIEADRPTRHDLGDIDSLAASIAVEGMRHPILLTPTGELLKGERKVAAVKLLGWTSAPTRVVASLEVACKLITEWADESSKPRGIVETVGLGMQLELLPRTDGGTRRGGWDTYQLVGSTVTPSGATYKRSRVIVAASQSQGRPAHVVDTAQQVIRAIDAGVMTVWQGFEKIKAAEKAAPMEGLGPDGLPMLSPPLGTARSPKARALRVQWLKALAAKGATSQQIALRLGLSDHGLRNIARQEGVDIVADKALGKGIMKARDVNRTMEVAVSDLDALVWSLDSLELTELDPLRVADWADQLRSYARSIDRVSKKMKGNR